MTQTADPTVTRIALPAHAGWVGAAFLALATALFLRTGRIPTYWGPCDRREEPFQYWFYIGVLMVLVAGLVLLGFTQ